MWQGRTDSMFCHSADVCMTCDGCTRGVGGTLAVQVLLADAEGPKPVACELLRQPSTTKGHRPWLVLFDRFDIRRLPKLLYCQAFQLNKLA